MMKPFPKGFEIRKFDKYRGTGNPKDHIREFWVHCMEFAYDDTYLMWLFPRSFSGHAMEWFSRLPIGIKTFQEIIDAFIKIYACNIAMDVSLEELSALKQGKNESFTLFLQRWRSKANQSKWTMPEEQQVCTIISNLDGLLEFHLKVQGITTYDQLISKALNIERALMTQPARSTSYPEQQNNYPPTNYNDKPRTWARNKNVTNDGAIDTKVVISAPRQNTPAPQIQIQHQNNHQATQEPSNNQIINNLNDQRGPPQQNKKLPQTKIHCFGGTT